jgi:hypothetical protein
MTRRSPARSQKKKKKIDTVTPAALVAGTSCRLPLHSCCYQSRHRLQRVASLILYGRPGLLVSNSSSNVKTTKQKLDNIEIFLLDITMKYFGPAHFGDDL